MRCLSFPTRYGRFRVKVYAKGVVVRDNEFTTYQDGRAYFDKKCREFCSDYGTEVHFLRHEGAEWTTVVIGTKAKVQ